MNHIDNTERLALALFQKGTVSKAHFDWRLFGYECGVCFNTIPPNITFLNGVIDANYVKKVRNNVHKEEHQPLAYEGCTTLAELSKKRKHASSDAEDASYDVN